MKNPKLNPADFAIIQALASALCDMNKRDDVNSGQYPAGHANARFGTYGHISNAITAFVLNQTGLDISNEDWNFGGNKTPAHDIQEAIYSAVERQHDDQRQKACEESEDGDLTFSTVKRELATLGVSIKREPSGEDYLVSIKNESPASWYLTSSLLDAFAEGQRKALNAIRNEGPAFRADG